MEDFDVDFQKELSINKYRLDEECLSHSSKYAYWAEAQALAKTELSKAKDNLEYVSSEANLRIREQYEKMGKKVTESVISSAISMDSEVREAKDKLRKAEEIYNRLTVAVQAMDTRRSELDNLVKLYCAGYFSTVTVSSGTRKDVNEQTSGDIRRNLNRKEREND